MLSFMVDDPLSYTQFSGITRKKYSNKHNLGLKIPNGDRTFGSKHDEELN